MIRVTAKVPIHPIGYGVSAENAKLLEDGKKYRLMAVVPRSPSCEVYLEGFGGVSFNSAWFEEGQ